MLFTVCIFFEFEIPANVHEITIFAVETGKVVTHLMCALDVRSRLLL